MSGAQNDIGKLVRSYLSGTLSPEEKEELFRMLGDDNITDDWLDDPALPRMEPDNSGFRQKSRLLRSYSDLTEEQLEMLCIACAEGDLLPDQIAEFEDYCNSDRQRQQTLSLYRKLRLEPGTFEYPGKEKLKRRSPFARIVRIGAMTLSAAASIAVLVIAFGIAGRRTMPPSGQDVVAEVTPQVTDNPPSVTPSSETVISKPSAASETPVGTPAAGKIVVAISENLNSPPEIEEMDTPIPERIIVAPVAGSPVPVRIAAGHFAGRLTDVQPADVLPYHGSLSLKDHIAMMFREKILGESIPDPSPLKAWEIAGAGITGINKLLGWEMAYEVTEGEPGEANTHEFSSRFIKFQTPMKKVDPGQ